MNPWWQVDLGDVFLVDRLVLHNDTAMPARLRFFTILFSLDGESWTPVFAKRDNRVFGAPGEPPLTIRLGGGRLAARHVRLRLDGYDHLTFERLEVFGRAARKPVSSVGSGPVRKRLPATVEIAGLKIALDRDNYSDVMIKTLTLGSYEERERQILPHALAPGDRVLEVGGAIGVVTMLAARIVGAANVLTFDGNPRMVEDARRNFDLNGFHDIQVRNAILKNAASWKGPDETVDFFVSRNFWASGLTLRNSSVAKVQVPACSLEAVIAEHRANVLICDIEGGELELLPQADLSAIDTIMMEVHYFAGEEATNRMVRRLIASGFSIDLAVSGDGVILLHRGFRRKTIAGAAREAGARKTVSPRGRRYRPPPSQQAWHR